MEEIKKYKADLLILSNVKKKGSDTMIDIFT